jgi:hypothetical protein
MDSKDFNHRLVEIREEYRRVTQLELSRKSGRRKSAVCIGGSLRLVVSAWLQWSCFWLGWQGHFGEGLIFSVGLGSPRIMIWHCQG